VSRPYRGWLYSTRMCESGGRYGTNTGNGFYGAYQFMASTWRAAGGRGLPHLAEPLEQDYRAVRWRLMIGNPHTRAGWPVCG
jgi:resuscitation-promoting factor RpfA